MNKPILLPSADHPITIEKLDRVVTVTSGGQIVARSADALMLKEASYPDAIYIPRKDVNMALLKPSASKSYCPYKGDATYFDIIAGENTSLNAVWTYEEPYESVSSIQSHVSFYSNRVDSIS